MASVNKVILIGNVGNAPEIRYMPNGEAVANFSIATTDTWKDKQGQKQERTEWHRIVAYRKLAEIVESYVGKGKSVYISGSIQSQKYTDKQGVDKVSFQIIADELRLLDRMQEQQQQSAPKENAPQEGFNPDDPMDFESNIPF